MSAVTAFTSSRQSSNADKCAADHSLCKRLRIIVKAANA